MSDASSLYSDESIPHQQGKKIRGRHINLYDAVAGMLFSNPPCPDTALLLIVC